VIVSFGNALTEDIFHANDSARRRRFPRDVLPAAQRKLDLLNAAKSLKDVGVPPANKLKALQGNLSGYHSIRINDQWRITFRWTAAGPEEVTIVDYH
jgi:proteic killer suppression protein